MTTISTDEINYESENINKFPKKEFFLKNDEIDYLLKIIKGQNEIIFLMTKIDGINVIKYKISLKLNDFYNSNKFFKQFLNIEELFTEYFEFIKDNEIIIKYKDNKVILGFKLETKAKKDELLVTLESEQKNNNIHNFLNDEVDILKNDNKINKNDINILKQEQKELRKILEEKINQTNVIFEQKIKDYYYKITSLIYKSYEYHKEDLHLIKQKYKQMNDDIKKENKELLNKINYYKNEINYLKKENEELNNKLSKYQTENEGKIKDNQNISINNKQNIQQTNNNISFLFDEQSNIIKEDEIYLIQEGITKNFHKIIKKYNLLFRASRDGFRALDFHSKCDEKDFTVVLVKTKVGRRFGGFTDAKWDQSSSYKKGGNGFIFSLTNREIYYNKNDSHNIYCDIHYGPIFGKNDFYISNDCNINKNSCDISNNSYDTRGKLYAMANAPNYYVEEYEVFQIDLE